MDNSEGYHKPLQAHELRVFEVKDCADNFTVLPPRWAGDRWRDGAGWQGISTSASGHVSGSGTFYMPVRGKKASLLDLDVGGFRTVTAFFDIPPIEVWYVGWVPRAEDNVVREVRAVRVQQRLRYEDWEAQFDPPDDKKLRRELRRACGALSLPGHWAPFGPDLLMFYPADKHPCVIRATRQGKETYDTTKLHRV
jgi:hypothetical protein